jgi:(p)ppGpp synthase/HD superfamily hydrolase
MEPSDTAALAAVLHWGQTDKAGEPYIEHVRRVADAVARSHDGPDYEMAAWLHDLVEDTEVTLDVLRGDGVPEDVLQAVDALTRRQGERYRAYLDRVAADPIAVAVKRADLDDNSDPARLAKLDPSLSRRLAVKYATARRRLEARVG